MAGSVGYKHIPFELYFAFNLTFALFSIWLELNKVNVSQKSSLGLRRNLTCVETENKRFYTVACCMHANESRL